MGNSENNIRIDSYIPKILDEMSRSKVQRLIESGNILVNNKQERVSYKVKENDVITIDEPEPIEIDLEPEEIPVNVLYEDEDIIVIDKPKGLVVHPANGNTSHTLVNALLYKCQGSLSGIGGRIRPRNCA